MVARPYKGIRKRKRMDLPGCSSSYIPPPNMVTRTIVPYDLKDIYDHELQAHKKYLMDKKTDRFRLKHKKERTKCRVERSFLLQHEKRPLTSIDGKWKYKERRVLHTILFDAIPHLISRLRSELYRYRIILLYDHYLCLYNSIRLTRGLEPIGPSDVIRGLTIKYGIESQTSGEWYLLHQ